MSNHGTALTPGQRAEFLKAGIGALTLLSHDPNLDPVIADSWAHNGEAMLRGFGGLLIPPPAQLASGIVKTSIVVIGGGRTTDQIVETARKLEGKDRPSYINEAITQGNMPSGNGRRRPVVASGASRGRLSRRGNPARPVCRPTGAKAHRIRRH